MSEHYQQAIQQLQQELQHSITLVAEQVERGFTGVHTRLDGLNGRTRSNEQAIAVLQDRDQQARKTAIKWSGVISAAAALGGWLAERFWK